MKKVITSMEKEEWIDYVKRSINYDFYHSWVYHTLDEGGIPLLFVYEEQDDFIAFPLLKRKIPSTELFDLRSVYGYSGPLSNKNFGELKEQFIRRFKISFLNFLSEEKIISIFSRLHPFFNQNPLLSKFGGVCDNGKVVAIDLTLSLEEQRAHYHKSALKKVKQLKQNGYYVKQSTELEDISTFNAIYTANMQRMGASKSYMFSDRYFIELLRSSEFDARLMLVYNDEEYPICGGIMVFTNQIIQAHLLVTRQGYLVDSPAKFLIDEVSILGRKMGMKYYNLGGGVGFKEDSLFNWKSTFSRLTLNYYSWRYIVNQSVYNDILNKFDIDPQSTIDLFPLYRSGMQTGSLQTLS